MSTRVLAGRYRLEEQIASGGMGAVWRARDEVLQRLVAVKVLHETLAGDVMAAERFRREALLAASISHPNMANVFDYIEDDGRPSIVMELVDNETLAERIARDGAQPPEEAARITIAVLDALEAAHGAGVVHRDIKPGNILLMPSGTVKVTDFGIARSLGDAGLTTTGNVMGTAHYSAPEQVRGLASTAASDLYSLGVVLYEMLTGARPFTGDTPVAVAMARLGDPPPSPRMRNAGIPVAVEQVVMRALARDPADRFPDAASMRMALQDAVAGQGADHTQVIAAGSMDETIALSSTAALRDRPAAPDRAAPAGVAEVVPPRWWGRRVMLVLLPLLLVALLAWLVFAALGGPDLVVAPDLTGKTMQQAKALAADAGVKLDAREVSSTRREGTILEQSPPAGREIEAGSTVTVEVSRGDLVNVPDVQGRSEREAKQRLEDRGLDVGRIAYQITSAAAFGTVIEQDPAAGANVRPGRNVDLVVAIAPARDRDEDRDKGKGKGKNGGDDDD